MSDDNIVTFGGNNSKAGASGEGGNNSKATPKEDETQFVAVCLECRCRTFNCFADGTIKSLSDWSTSGHLCFVGGYNLSGEGRYWLDINTEEQRQWVLEKLAEMIHFVSDADIETTNELQIIPINKEGNNV